MESYGWIIVAIGAFALLQIGGILRSVQSTEAMLKRLLVQNGVQWGTAVEPSAQVKELALDSRKYVEAIKAYREQTGLGLKEARGVVDELARAHQGGR
jgi:ribosomal protein L7/L12